LEAKKAPKNIFIKKIKIPLLKTSQD